MAALGANVCFSPMENSHSLGKSRTYSQNSPLLFQVLSETITDADSEVDLQMGTVVHSSDEKDIRCKALKC